MSRIGWAFLRRGFIGLLEPSRCEIGIEIIPRIRDPMFRSSDKCWSSPLSAQQVQRALSDTGVNGSFASGQVSNHFNAPLNVLARIRSSSRKLATKKYEIKQLAFLPGVH
jgi:hypothetical protein